MSPAPRGVWWLSPPGAVALVVPVTLMLAVSFDDARFRAAYGTPKSLTASTATLMAIGTLLFVCAALVPLLGRTDVSRSAWPGLTPAQVPVLSKCCTVLFRVTVAGYVAFAVVGLARGATPAVFIQAATAQDNFGSPLRALFAPVAGVTTLTQVGIAYVVAAMVLYCQERDPALLRRIGLLLALALLRTFFLAERLAVLELAIPAATVACLAISSSSRGSARRLVRLAPLILVPSVIILFSTFEYSRSWVFYSRTSQGSFVDFAVERLAGYYATAYNNGQLSISYSAGDTRLPYGSVEAIWTAPVVSQLDVYTRLTGDSQPDAFSTILERYGNPEFNSPGGLGVPFVDYGPVGGLVFFVVAGGALGYSYRRCCEGASWAVLLYPVAVTGLFELPRYLYWGQGRVAPAIVCLLLVHWRLTAARQTGDPAPAVTPAPA